MKHLVAVRANRYEIFHPRPRALAAYEPGPGRIPGFQHALVCPSVVDGVRLHRLSDVAGLPAYAAPDDPWMYDGRIVLWDVSTAIGSPGEVVTFTCGILNDSDVTTREALRCNGGELPRSR